MRRTLDGVPCAHNSHSRGVRPFCIPRRVASDMKPGIRHADGLQHDTYCANSSACADCCSSVLVVCLWPTAGWSRRTAPQHRTAPMGGHRQVSGNTGGEGGGSHMPITLLVTVPSASGCRPSECRVPTDVLPRLDSRARPQLLLFANESCDVRKACSVCVHASVLMWCVIVCSPVAGGRQANGRTWSPTDYSDREPAICEHPCRCLVKGRADASNESKPLQRDTRGSDGASPVRIELEPIRSAGFAERHSGKRYRATQCGSEYRTHTVRRHAIVQKLAYARTLSVACDYRLADRSMSA